MKKHFKTIAVAYLAAICLLLVLEYSQYQKVDRLRSEITESYHLISGRDEGLRLELEFRKFREKLTEYVHSDISSPQVTNQADIRHEDVLKWFDIVWSRVFSINSEHVRDVEAKGVGFERMLTDLRETFTELDPLIQSIRPGDFADYDLAAQKLAHFDHLITDYASRIAQSRLEQASELQSRLTGALGSIDKLLISSGIGGALILTMFGVEAFRARRDETRTRAREARVRFLAEHDPLTGLGNRTFLNDKMVQFIDEASEKGTKFHLLLLDLDKFKDVNDTFGHPVGDRLLKKAAARLCGIFHCGDDILVRLGGDEFAVLTRMDMASTQKAADKAIMALSAAFDLAGNEIRISTSIGISSFPELSNTSDELMRDADLALYAAKSNGRRSYCVFKPSMSIAVQQRVRLEADLRHALAADGLGLEVFYQPQVDLSTPATQRQIIGVEALVRWFHPEMGQIPTMEFIDIAETSGLIDDLSDWIVRQACLDVGCWHKAGFMLNLSVNLSPFQLNNPKLPEELLEHLETCNFDPHLLTLEITESADVDDKVAAAKMLNRLAEHGICLAMDDFGTGYSNLGYLNSLPLHTLKIDRSFVMQIDEADENRKLVRGIINLAKGMDLKIVAEGVETEEQAVFLCQQGCEIGQGYLFGKPIHKLGMLALLNQQYEQKELEVPALEA